MEKIEWTVLLLYPDYMSDNYGLETYLDVVEAVDPREALRLAQTNAQASAGEDVVSDPTDFACVFCARGSHLDYADGEGGVLY